MRKVRQGFLPLSGLVPAEHPRRIPVKRMKYPKLAAAIDEFLAKQVRENGEDLITFAIASLTKGSEIAPEKAVAIPVTKELVLSEQTEVRTDEH